VRALRASSRRADGTRLRRDTQPLYLLLQYLVEVRDPADPSLNYGSPLLASNMSKTAGDDGDFVASTAEVELMLASTGLKAADVITALRTVYERSTGRAELLRGGRLQLVFFERPAMSKQLRDADLDILRERVLRVATPDERRHDFDWRIRGLARTLRIRHETLQYWPLQVLADLRLYAVVTTLALLLIVAQNVIFMLSDVYSTANAQSVQFVLGIILTVLVSLQLASKSVVDFRTEYANRYEKFNVAQRRGLGRAWAWIRTLAYPLLLYYAFAVAATILGLVHRVEWYAFNVLELLVATRIRFVARVIARSVLNQVAKLLVVVSLGLLVIYLLANVALVNFGPLLISPVTMQSVR
jgi:hypothetical protein